MIGCFILSYRERTSTIFLQPASCCRTHFRCRPAVGMLPLLLLLPLCWAVEVKRPRGVSLSSEFSLCIATWLGEAFTASFPSSP